MYTSYVVDFSSSSCSNAVDVWSAPKGGRRRRREEEASKYKYCLAKHQGDQRARAMHGQFVESLMNDA